MSSSLTRLGLATASLAVLLATACNERPIPASPLAPSGSSPDYVIETVAEGLDHPWSLAFLPEGGLLVTERSGQLRRIRDGVVGAPIAGVPPVYNEGQAGLFDVVLAPDFEQSGALFLTYADGTRDNNGTAIWRARLDGDALVDGVQIFVATPLKDTNAHYGARLVFLPDDTLLMAIGEGFAYREQAQNRANDLGAIVRLDRDGRAAIDNPFLGEEGVRPEIWSYGHRNPQGLVYDPVHDRVWEHEHGPQGGDELNLILPGNNYGWPIATAGLDYSGALISPYATHEGFAAPQTQWVPSIAPSGLALYQGDAFPAWQGDLFVGGLASRDVHRLVLDGTTVIAEEVLFGELDERIRDVRTGPDGYLYLLTDSDEGRILRVVPAGSQ